MSCAHCDSARGKRNQIGLGWAGLARWARRRGTVCACPVGREPERMRKRHRGLTRCTNGQTARLSGQTRTPCGSSKMPFEQQRRLDLTPSLTSTRPPRRFPRVRQGSARRSSQPRVQGSQVALLEISPPLPAAPTLITSYRVLDRRLSNEKLAFPSSDTSGIVWA